MKVWTKQGLEDAVKLILTENNTLFNRSQKLNYYSELKVAIRSILVEEIRISELKV